MRVACAVACVLLLGLAGCGGKTSGAPADAAPCEPFTCSLDCASTCPGDAAAGGIGTCTDAGCECDCIH